MPSLRFCDFHLDLIFCLMTHSFFNFFALTRRLVPQQGVPVRTYLALVEDDEMMEVFSYSSPWLKPTELQPAS
jgi:hypothetical protein